MKARYCFVAIALFGVLLAAQPAGARQWPHDRQGLILGFGVGGGSAQVSFTQDNTTVSSDREGGFAGAFRIGYAFSPRLALAFEGSSWTRKFTHESDLLGSVSDLDETWTLSTGTIALTWYPEGGGFYLRGGIGGGRTEVKLEQDNVDVTVHEDGAGGLLAVGYEWRLTRRFALGPAVTFSGMDLDHGWKANFTTLTLEFNWYL